MRKSILIVPFAVLAIAACGSESDPEGRAGEVSDDASSARPAPTQAGDPTSAFYWPEGAGPARDLKADSRACQEQVEAEFADVGDSARALRAIQCLLDLGWKTSESE